MMVEESTLTRPWVCPICTEQVTVTLTWVPKTNSLIKVLNVDDLDARVHMAWHSLCICQWQHDHSTEPVTVTRVPDAGCEMHP